MKEDGSPDGELCKRVCQRCEEKGLILIECGVDKNIIRFMPPLITTQGEMEEALDIFEEVLRGI